MQNLFNPLILSLIDTYTLLTPFCFIFPFGYIPTHTPSFILFSQNFKSAERELRKDAENVRWRGSPRVRDERGSWRNKKVQPLHESLEAKQGEFSSFNLLVLLACSVFGVSKQRKFAMFAIFRLLHMTH